MDTKVEDKAKSQRKQTNKKYYEKKKQIMLELDEAKIQLRIKDVEIEKLKKALDETSRDKIIANNTEQLTILNERLEKLKTYEKRIKQLEEKIKINAGWYEFTNHIYKLYPDDVKNVLTHLQNERLKAPLDPSALDKLVSGLKL